MAQITNLTSSNNNLESFNQLASEILVTAENNLVITNQTDQDLQQEITFNMESGSNLDLTIFDLAVDATRNLSFNLDADSDLNVVIISLNSGTTSSVITVNLNNQNANADVNVISVANSGANTNFNVICNNNAPFTTANITQRAVALNGGQNVFEATGYIGEMCSKAINFQESRVLLLDGAAKGDASPILLINHHDVEAGHAAGVSRVNDEEMYYLMSRGIDRKSAEQLMTVAFIRPVVDKITNQELREIVFEKINQKASYEIN